MPEVVKYKGKNYKVNQFNNLSRKQVRTLREAVTRANATSGEGVSVSDQLDASEALWDMVAVVLPGIPEKALDDMGMDDAQDLLRRAGIIQGAIAGDGGEGVSLGESSASTDS